MNDCPFCAIARGDGGSVEIVCEAPHWVAFFPPEPAALGHTLVIPRLHVADLWAADADLATELMQGAIRVGRAVRSALTPDGLNLISSSGTAAEQTVFHLHLHIVPRWANDEFHIWPTHRPMRQSVIGDVAKAVRTACVQS
jgi:histidine triad (HIT) family protein